MGRDANTPGSCSRLGLRVRGDEVEGVEYRESQDEVCQRKEPALQKSDWWRLASFQNSIGGE